MSINEIYSMLNEPEFIHRRSETIFPVIRDHTIKIDLWKINQWQWSDSWIDSEIRNHNMIASLVELCLMLETETRLGANRIAVPETIVSQINHSVFFLPFPFLVSATIADNDSWNLSAANQVKRKAYSLADKIGINIRNPFRNDWEMWMNESRFHRVSWCNVGPYLTQPWLVLSIYGKQNEILEKIHIFQDDSLNSAFMLPLKAIVNANNVYTPLYLSGKEHLIGLDLMPAQGVIYLTPDYMEQQLNISSVSWIGDLDAAEADVVDWSPIFNRSIVYSVNPTSFHGDVKTCLACMEIVCNKLSNNGCRVTLIVRKTEQNYDFYDRAAVYNAYNLPVPEGVTNWEIVLSDHKTSEIPVYLVDKLLFHRDISIVYADAGIGKSWFIDSVAAAVRCGTGISEHFSVDKPASTLVINGEMRQDELNKRCAVLDKLYPHGAEKSFCKSLRAPLPLDTPEGQAWLQEAIRQCNRHNPDCAPVSLVILDSLKTLTGDGENKRKWGTLFNLLDRMRTERDITFVIIQHENKAGQLYGTNDQKVKTNEEFQLTRDVSDITPTDPSDKFKTPKKYQDFLIAKLMEWREEHPDDIWFFLIPPKGRSMTPQDKRPVMLHFLPEAENPAWHCIDFLAKGHPWSIHAFMAMGNAGDTVTTVKTTDMENTENTGNLVQSYKRLLILPREEVIRWLKEARERSGKSRELLGRYFGVHKDQIDYLMRKKNIVGKDLN